MYEISCLFSSFFSVLLFLPRDMCVCYLFWKCIDVNLLVQGQSVHEISCLFSSPFLCYFISSKGCVCVCVLLLLVSFYVTLVISLPLHSYFPCLKLMAFYKFNCMEFV